MKIANNILKYRKQLGLSQEQLGDKIGVSRQAVSKWEIGESTPDLDKIVALSNLFNISTDILLGKEERREVPPLDYRPQSSSLDRIIDLIQMHWYKIGYYFIVLGSMSIVLSNLAGMLFKNLANKALGSIDSMVFDNGMNDFFGNSFNSTISTTDNVMNSMYSTFQIIGSVMGLLLVALGIGLLMYGNYRKKREFNK